MKRKFQVKIWRTREERGIAEIEIDEDEVDDIYDESIIDECIYDSISMGEVDDWLEVKNEDIEFDIIKEIKA